MAGPFTPDDAPWWTRAVVYQVYPRSFQDADGDGIGDLRGIIQRLDHLERLGVDVLWVSPFYPSPQADNGYDISDYRGVDPLFGTLDDVDELIAALHERGMKLVIDVVVNHSSDEHPWFVDARSSPDAAKRDWYWWRPAREGHEPGEQGAEPTNWRSFFGGSAWQLDEASGEYYLHLFDVKQPDLNWENPEVRAAVHELLTWWLDRGVDGFRLDVINFLSKDTALPDGPVAPGGTWGSGAAAFIDGPRMHEFLKELHVEVLAGRDEQLLTVGEMPGVTVEHAQQYTDQERHELDMVFHFEHVGLDQGEDKFDLRPLQLTELKHSLGRWQEGLAEVGWNSLYWCNHDQPRAVSRFGDDSPQWRRRSATALGTVLHLHRGTPFVYQGEELGLANFPWSELDQFRDVESVNRAAEALEGGRERGDVLTALRAKSRDNARTPMQWDGSAHAGFTTGEPWLPVNPDHQEWNAAAQVDDPGSVFAHYQRLVALRHEHAVVALGDFTMLLPDDEQVYAFTRRLGDEELLVLANISSEDATVDLDALDDADGWAGAEVLHHNLVDAETSPLATLQPWEAVVRRRTR